MMTRREFLKRSAIVAGGVLIPVSALEVLSPERLQAIKADKALRWVFLVDTERCVGCGFCVKACKLENEVPYEANATRTWVERYVLTKDGAFHADSPNGGRDGYTTPDIDQNESGMLADRSGDDRQGLLRPETLQPVRQSALRAGLPGRRHLQDARRGRPRRQEVVHRLRLLHHGLSLRGQVLPSRVPHGREMHVLLSPHQRGLPSACVQACPFGARQIGNMKDPDDPVAKTIATERVTVLKSEFGTKPQVYYVGLDSEVR